ncbi:O-antigen ligase family protein [Terrabacter terrae]|uniref:O-antigen ligase family protein n=1 Tax=Terrabacter terrae TaxID=318434 RepID=UPI0031DBC5E7
MWLYALGALAALAALIALNKTHARAVDLVVIGLPVATVIGGAARANLSPADLFLPFAAIAVIVERHRSRAPKGPTPRPTWALYVTATSIAVLLGLFFRLLSGRDADFGYGISAALKLLISFAYLGVFAYYGARLFRQGDRLLTLWVRVSTLAALAGVGGAVLYSFGLETPLTLGYRATGGFDDPNLFASYLLLGTALTFLAKERGAIKHPTIAAIAHVAAIIATGSRAAIPALLVGFGVAWLFGHSRTVFRAVAPFLVGFAAVAVIALWQFPDLLALGSITRVVDAQNSVESDVRLALWQAAASMWVDHPFIGVGIGQFRAAAHEYVSWDVENIPHSSHLSLLAETGTIGYLLVMGLPLSILFRLMAKAKRGRDATATWLLMGVAASLAVAWTLNLENARHLWAFLGLCLGCLASLRSVEADTEESSGAGEGVGSVPAVAEELDRLQARHRAAGRQDRLDRNRVPAIRR